MIAFVLFVTVGSPASTFQSMVRVSPQDAGYFHFLTKELWHFIIAFPMTDPAPRRTRSLVDLTVQSSHLLIPLTPASVLIYRVRWAPFQAAQNARDH